VNSATENYILASRGTRTDRCSTDELPCGSVFSREAFTVTAGCHASSSRPAAAAEMHGIKTPPGDTFIINIQPLYKLFNTFAATAELNLVKCASISKNDARNLFIITSVAYVLYKFKFGLTGFRLATAYKFEVKFSG